MKVEEPGTGSDREPERRFTISLTMLILMGLPVAVATELPGYDPLDMVVPKATSALVGEVISVTPANIPGNRILKLVIRPRAEVFGTMPKEGKFECQYTEFIPKLPNKPGLRVSFRNYTGSGIEFQAKPGEQYIFLLAIHRKGMMAEVLRLEPVAEMQRILKTKRQSDEKKGRKPRL